MSDSQVMTSKENSTHIQQETNSMIEQFCSKTCKEMENTFNIRKQTLLGKLDEIEGNLKKDFLLLDQKNRVSLERFLKEVLDSLDMRLADNEQIQDFDVNQWIDGLLESTTLKTSSSKAVKTDQFNETINKIKVNWQIKMDTLKTEIEKAIKTTKEEKTVTSSEQETLDSTMAGDDSKSKDENNDSMTTPQKPSQSQQQGQKGNLLSNLSGFFSKKKEPSNATPMKIDGQTKYTYIPGKGYQFEGEDEEEEEEDDAPPPTAFGKSNKDDQSNKDDDNDGTSQNKEEGKSDKPSTDSGSTTKTKDNPLFRPPQPHALRKKGKQQVSKSVNMGQAKPKPNFFVPTTTQDDNEDNTQNSQNKPDEGEEASTDLSQADNLKLLQVVSDQISEFRKEINQLNTTSYIQLIKQDLYPEINKLLSQKLALIGSLQNLEQFCTSISHQKLGIETAFKELQIQNEVQQQSKGQIQDKINSLTHEIQNLKSYNNSLQSIDESRQNFVVQNIQTQQNLIQVHFNAEKQSLDQQSTLNQKIKELEQQVFTQSSGNIAKINRLESEVEAQQKAISIQQGLISKLKQIISNQSKFQEDYEKNLILAKKENYKLLNLCNSMKNKISGDSEVHSHQQKEIARKNESLSYLVKEVEKMEGKIKSDQTLLNEKEQELNKFSIEFTKIAKQKKQLESQLQEENKNQLNLRTSVQIERQKFEEMIENASKNNVILQNFHNSLKRENKQLSSEIDEMEIRLSELAFQAESQKSQSFSLINTFLQEQFHQSLSNSELNEDDSFGLESALSEFMSIIKKQLQDNINKEKAEQKVHSEQLSILEQKINAMQKSNDILTAQVTLAKNVQSNSENCSINYPEQIACLNRELYELKQENSDLLKQLAQKEEKQSEMNSQITQLLKTQSNELNKDLQKSQNETGKISKELQEKLSLALTNLTQQRFDAIQAKEALQEQLKGLIDSNEALKQENEEIQDQVQSGFEKYKQLQDKYKQIAMSYKEKELKLKEYEQQNETLKEDFNKQKDIANASQDKIEEYSQKLDFIRAEVQKRESELAIANQNEEKFNDLQSKFEEINTKYDNVKSQQSLEENENKSTINELKSQITNLQRQLSQSDESLKNMDEQHQNEILKLNSKISELEEDLKTKCELNANKDTLTTNSQELLEQIKNEILANEFLQQSFEKENLNDIFSEEQGITQGITILFRKLNSEFEDLVQKIENKEYSIMSLTQNLDDVNEQYQKAVHDLNFFESNPSANDQDYNSLKTIFEKKSKKVDELAKELSEKNDMISNLQKLADQNKASPINQDEKSKNDDDSNNNNEENLTQNKLEENIMLKDKVNSLSKELEKEQARAQKYFDQIGQIQRNVGNTHEENDTKLRSYREMIKAFGVQIDELKKKKGLNEIKKSDKGCQAPEDLSKPAETSSGGGLLSGVVKLFT